MLFKFQFLQIHKVTTLKTTIENIMEVTLSELYEWVSSKVYFHYLLKILVT